MTEMFGEAWSPMSVPDLAPDDDDDDDFDNQTNPNRNRLYLNPGKWHRLEMRFAKIHA